jgi:hypothetical protein
MKKDEMAGRTGNRYDRCRTWFRETVPAGEVGREGVLRLFSALEFADSDGAHHNPKHALKVLRRFLLRETMAVRASASPGVREQAAVFAMRGTGTTYSKGTQKRLKNLVGEEAKAAASTAAAPTGGHGYGGGKGKGKGKGGGGGAGAGRGAGEGGPAGGVPINISNMPLPPANS